MKKQTSSADKKASAGEPAPPTVSHLLGEMTWLLTQSPLHRALSIGDLEWLVMPALLNQQFYLFRDGQQPVGLAMWAKCTPEAVAKLDRGMIEAAPRLRLVVHQGVGFGLVQRKHARVGQQEIILLNAQMHRVGAQPVAVVGGQAVYSGELVHSMLALYGAENKSISDADRDMLPALYKYIPGDVRTTDVDFDFAMQLVTHLRATLHLAPSTIRARVGCLSRAWKWFHAVNKQHSVVNPFDLRPHGYSIPNREEQEKILEEGGDVNMSSGRERRLEPGEEERIVLAMHGKPTIKNARAMPPQPELQLLFELIINTGLRRKRPANPS